MVSVSVSNNRYLPTGDAGFRALAYPEISTNVITKE
jgi:hypothetical protein